MENSGETVELSEDSPFQVQLEGNPTTGYEWTILPYNTSVIEMIGEPQFEVDNPDLVGSGGTYTFTFKAKSSGQAELKMIYNRKFETDKEPLKTFSLNIIVGTMGRITAE